MVAGYYAAPDNIKEYSIDKLGANRIVDKIAANSSQAFVVIVFFSFYTNCANYIPNILGHWYNFKYASWRSNTQSNPID